MGWTDGRFVFGGMFSEGWWSFILMFEVCRFVLSLAALRMRPGSEASLPLMKEHSRSPSHREEEEDVSSDDVPSHIPSDPSSGTDRHSSHRVYRS